MDAHSRGTDTLGGEVIEALLHHVSASGGWAVGPYAADERPEWAAELIRRFNDAKAKTHCPHLTARPRASLWLAAAPDLLACIDCADELVRRVEQRLGHPLVDEPSRCSICDQQAPVRGVSIAAGNILLRGMLCADCQPGEMDGDHSAGETVVERDEDSPSPIPAPLEALGLPPILVDRPLLSSTTDRTDFDELGWHMLARAGRLSEQLVAAVNREIEQRGSGLDLDQAVIGGLLVRVAKLTRAVFDSTQADESEAHSPLARCLAETAITLRWLVYKDESETYRRFRADSFAPWRQWLKQAEATDGEEDETQRTVRLSVEARTNRELAAAGLTWAEVPDRPNTWGPNARQRFEALGQGWIYEALFVSHSHYIHPSWHELRAFHLATDGDGLHSLDDTYAGIAPVAAYVLSRLAVEACRDAAASLPHELDTEALTEVVSMTVRAIQTVSADFADFITRGGIDADLQRNQAAP